MIDWKTITKQELASLSFESIDAHKPEPFYPADLTENEMCGRARMTDSQLGDLRREQNKNIHRLIQKILNICHEKLDGETNNLAEMLGTRIHVSESLVRKIFSETKPITPEFVALICVELHLPEAVSNELFDLLGYRLFPEKCGFDAVTLVAIRDNDDINTYIEDLKKTGVKLRIFSWGNA